DMKFHALNLRVQLMVPDSNLGDFYTGNQAAGSVGYQFELAADMAEQSLHDGQTQAGAADPGAGGFAPRDGAQEALYSRRRNSCALVAYFDGQDIALLPGTQSDAGTSVAWRTTIAPCVLDQIADYALQVVSADLGVQIGLDISCQLAILRLGMRALALVQLSKGC